MLRYRCAVCEYVYEPKLGDAATEVDENTPFEELPDDWVCPQCGSPKEDFLRL